MGERPPSWADPATLAGLAGAERATLAVLADTHLSDPARRWLPATALAHLQRADAVLHAGDVTAAAVLDRLAEVAPTLAVLGNNDRDLVGVLPPTVGLQVAGAEVAMVHDSGAAAGRERRLRRRFPGADVVVFGHSHIPWDAEGEGGQRLLNPGSPTARRRQPRHTMGLVELAGGRVAATRIVPLD